MFPSGGPDLPAVKFVSVEGHEEREEDSPSYFNHQEIVMVAEQARTCSVFVCGKGGGGGGGGVMPGVIVFLLLLPTAQAMMLVGGGVRPQDVCVLAYYTKQVQRVRNNLRKKGLGQVSSSVCVCDGDAL